LIAGCSRDPGSVVAPGDASLAPLVAHRPGAQAIPGSYIVVFKGTDGAHVDPLVREFAGRFGFRSRFLYRSAVHGFAGTLTPDAVRQLRSDPRVAYVEEDQVVHADVLETGATWGLDRIDQTRLPLTGSYTYTLTGAGVDAYIID